MLPSMWNLQEMVCRIWLRILHFVLLAVFVPGLMHKISEERRLQDQCSPRYNLECVCVMDGAYYANDD